MGISESMYERNQQRTARKKSFISELKLLSNDLEIMERRILDKFKKLNIEEERYEKLFEKQSRKWICIVKDKNQKLNKRKEHLKERIE